MSSLASMAIYAVGLLTGPILARALGPTGRGDVAAVMAPVAILGWLLPFGLPLAAAYMLDRISEAKLLSTATVFGIVVGGPVCAVLWFAAPAYLADHSSTAQSWARLLLVCLPLTVGISTALEIRRRRGADARWNFWRTSPVAIPAIAVVVLGLTGTLTLKTALAANALGGVFPLLLLVSRFRAAPLARPSLAALRTMLPYAWRATAAVTTTAVTTRFDQLVLVPVVSPAELGLYAVAVTTASITNPVTVGFSLALFGHLREETVPRRAAARFRRSLAVTALLSSIVAVGIGLLAPLVLRVAFGGSFEDATLALRLLLPGVVAFDVLGVIATKLYADGRPGETTRASVLGAAITLVGLVALAPRLGIEGAAAVTSVAFVAEVVFLVARGALRPSAPTDDPLAEVIPEDAGRPEEVMPPGWRPGT